jgi:flagellar motor switch protein FliM
VGFQNDQLEVDQIWINRIKSQLMGTHVNITAHMGDAWISMRDLMEMSKGDIIQLDHDASRPLEIKIEGVLKMRGVPGVVKGNKAIKITEVIGES